MAFPPNYRQERNNRDKAKQQKAAQKQAERDARAAERKTQNSDAPQDGAEHKDQD